MSESLTVEDFSRLLGTSIDDFDDECREFIRKTDFQYRKVSHTKRDQTIVEILKRIDSGQMTLAGKVAKGRWEKGWTNNLQNFVGKGYNLAELVPKYVRPDQILRLYRDYVMPLEANFEINFFTVLRLWLFKKYLKEFDSIYEFACGTGYNLSLLAGLFPQKKLYGLDWTEASVKLVNLIGEKHGMNVTGCLFDMFSPDYTLEIAKNSAIMTIGGLEQLGDGHKAFVEFLIEKEPRLCIHVEPLCELYDKNNLLDYLAVRFHEARNYLRGFLTNLKKLERENKIEIIKTQRMYFGSLYHDGWSLLIWRPKKIQN